jgi:hypothetical protein
MWPQMRRHLSVNGTAELEGAITEGIADFGAV